MRAPKTHSFSSMIVALVSLHLAACGDDPPMGTDATPSSDAAVDTDGDAGEAPTPVAPEAGQLLIEELYYAGAPPAGGTDHYFSDQFIELVNAAEVPLDLSALVIGEVVGVAGEINPGTAPNSFRETNPDEVVLSTVWRIPFGTVLEPGAHLVIAHDGTNHRPFSSVDLSGADFEAYVEDSGDEDSVTVANLESVQFRGGRDWLLTVFGPSLVLVDGATALGDLPSPGGGFKTAPVAAVIDAIETVMDGASGDFKRLPDAVDTGYVWVSGTYTGQSLHRRRDSGGYVDTDDSGADFEIGAPDPGLPAVPRGVSGEPFVELGTGASAFASLAEGADVELVAGLQGGWHVDVSTRLGGFGPDGVILTYEALSEDGEPISFATQAELRTASVIAEGESWVRVGDRVVLDISDPGDVIGAPVTLRVSATLADVSVSDERAVVVVDAEP